MLKYLGQTTEIFCDMDCSTFQHIMLNETYTNCIVLPWNYQVCVFSPWSHTLPQLHHSPCNPCTTIMHGYLPHHHFHEHNNNQPTMTICIYMHDAWCTVMRLFLSTILLFIGMNHSIWSTFRLGPALTNPSESYRMNRSTHGRASNLDRSHLRGLASRPEWSPGTRSVESHRRSYPVSAHHQHCVMGFKKKRTRRGERWEGEQSTRRYHAEQEKKYMIVQTSM